jgi:hypothetical protein
LVRQVTCCAAGFQCGLCRLWVKRVTSVHSRRSRNVRYASNTDRIDASQQNVATCHKQAYGTAAASLFYDIIGELLEMQKHLGAECFGGPASGVASWRSSLLSVCLFEQAQGLFYVVGLLPQRFRIPLASLGSKEIASVNVNGASQT